MVRLLGGLSAGAVIFYFIRDSYIGELVSSFLPYVVGVWMLCAIVALIIALASKRRRTKIVSGMSFLVLVMMSVWGGSKIYDFYDGVVGGDGERGFSVLYNNIFIHNREYDALQEVIGDVDPDVLILVEFARHHRSALEGFLGEQGLTHTNRINRQTLYDSNLLATHTPIDQVITYGGLDDYINIESQELTLSGRAVMFHVVHTISPISPDHFDARNRQLETLAQLMNQATHDYPDHTHILLGDFNTSPWSVYYDDFQTSLGAEWINQTRQLPLLMTRKLPFAPWIRSHIDHVWVWGDVQVEIDPLWLDGSDHGVLEIGIER